MLTETKKFQSRLIAAIEKLEEIPEPTGGQSLRLQILEDLLNAVEEAITDLENATQ